MGKIIISGANGNLGRIATETLIGLVDKEDVVLAAPSVDMLENYVEQGYDCRPANFNDPEGLKTTFEGCDTLVLISLPQVGPKRRQLHTNALVAAYEAGVRRVCYTSITGCDNLENAGYEIADHRYTEYLIQALGFKYVFMRNSQYAEAMVMNVLSAAEAGETTAPNNQGDGKMAYVSRKDCAVALAYAAAGDYEDEVFYISGPRLCTLQEFYDVIAPAFNTKIEVVWRSDEDCYAAFDAIGVPRTTEGEWATEEAKRSPFCSKGMVTFGAAIRAGQMDSCTDDFEKLTGRKPISLEYIAEHIDDFYIGERHATEE